jgi:hypothetical protein
MPHRVRDTAKKAEERVRWRALHSISVYGKILAGTARGHLCSPTALTMKQRRSFDGLIRHRKKLIGPLSAIRVGKRGELITFVSWADDGAAELLWLCCLVQQYGFDRCLALISALARVAQTRDMKDRARFLFFSRLASVDVAAIKETFENVSDPEIVATYWQLFHFFASISGIRKRRLTRAKEMACLPIVSGAVRPATDKENPLALKAMALLVKCEIESDGGRASISAAVIEPLASPQFTE